MNNDHDALKLLTDNERLVEKMYAFFAENFNDYYAFWNKLSGEEEYHAKMIEKLEEKINQELVVISDNRFNFKAMNAIKNYAEKVFDEFSQSFTKEADKDQNFKKMALRRAFEISIEVEKSMIERNVFDIFQTDSPELTTLLNTLKKQTIDHENRIIAEQKKFFERKNN